MTVQFMSSRIKDFQKKDEYIQKARAVENKYGIPNDVLVGLLRTESNFREEIITGKVKSKVGATGIAQFMPKTAKQYGIDPLNVDQSIDAAGKYLVGSYKTFGNWDDALRSYNMGVQGVKDWKAGKRTLPKETQEYVGKVYETTSTYDRDVAPYIKSEKINLHNPNYISNIVPQKEYSVPDVYEEPKEESEPQQTQQETVETPTDYFKKLQEYYNNSTIQQEEPLAKKEEQEFVPPTDVFQTYNEISQFVDNPVAQEGKVVKKPFKLQDERSLVQRDATEVNAQRFRPLQQLNVVNKTDKEIATEREAKIKASVEAQKTPYTKENWRRQLAAETAATGDKLRISNEPNFFDEYLNPATMIGNMASNLGQAPLQAEQSDSILPYFTSIGVPLATGAIAGVGANSTGQFVNNLTNPLEGVFGKNKTEVLTNLYRDKGQQTFVGKYNTNSKLFNPENIIIDNPKYSQSSNKVINIKPPTVLREPTEPYISKKVFNDSREQQVFESSFQPEQQSRLLEQRTKYYDANGNEITKPSRFLQTGGITQDNNGYYNPQNWGQPVEINSNNITMDNIKEPLWAISDTGELRLLQPNKNYTFKDATSVTEYPLLTEEERTFLNGMKNYKNK